jgi:pSer/pThr/pTyr-binding forkhead associated (FHA) protein
MSKTHAAIAQGPAGQLLIEDLESTNGTFIAGNEAFETQVNNGAPQEIRVGDRVRLGDVYFDVTFIQPEV